MMGLYLIKRTDGGVSIMRTVADDTDPESEIARWHPNDRDEVLSVQRIEESDIPTDRYFRDAWRSPDSRRIQVNMPKARDIHRAALRRRRKPLMAALDTEYMRADEAGDVGLKAQIIARKQALRDVPQDPRIERADTPDKLKAVIPAVLVSD